MSVSKLTYMVVAASFAKAVTGYRDSTIELFPESERRKAPVLMQAAQLNIPPSNIIAQAPSNVSPQNGSPQNVSPQNVPPQNVSPQIPQPQVPQTFHP